MYRLNLLISISIYRKLNEIVIILCIYLFMYKNYKIFKTLLKSETVFYYLRCKYLHKYVQIFHLIKHFVSAFYLNNK